MLKDFQVDLELSPRDNRVIQTGATYWSHDVNTAKIVVNLKRNSEPIILSSTVSVRMIMVFDDNDTQKKQVHKMTIDDTQNGVVSLVLPKETLGFVGNVLCGVYVNYGENQSTDNGYFTFSMRRSLIDGEFPQLENGYVSEFKTMLDYMIETASEFDNVEEELNKRIDVIEKDIASNEIVKKNSFEKLNNFVDNMELNTLNMIKNSDFDYDNPISLWQDDGVSTKKEGDFLKLFPIEGTNKRLYHKEKLDIEEGDFLSISLVAYAEEDGVKISVGTYDNLKPCTLSTEPQKITIGNIKHTGDSKNFNLVLNQFEAVYVRKIMVNKSNKNADYSINESERATKKDISNLQKQIDELNKAITNLGGTL